MHWIVGQALPLAVVKERRSADRRRRFGNRRSLAKAAQRSLALLEIVCCGAGNFSPVGSLYRDRIDK
jgi:hypothetical protein